MKGSLMGFIYVYSDCIWTHDSPRWLCCYDFCIFVALIISSFFLYSYTWLCINDYDYGKLVVIIWRTILRITLWLRCAMFTNKLIILWLKGHYHLMNQCSIIMICCWTPNAFFDKNKLKQSLHGLLSGIMLSTEWIWMWGGFL